MPTKVSPSKTMSLYLVALARALAQKTGPEWRKMPASERQRYVAAARRVLKVQHKWAQKK